MREHDRGTDRHDQRFASPPWLRDRRCRRERRFMPATRTGLRCRHRLRYGLGRATDALRLARSRLRRGSYALAQLGALIAERLSPDAVHVAEMPDVHAGQVVDALLSIRTLNQQHAREAVALLGFELVGDDG